MCKYIIVAGGVISGIGKGVAASSIGLLLKLRGHDVTCLKLDGYGNIDCGIINPTEHGNPWVTECGQEADLDLGHYERIIDICTTKKNICTAGTIHKEIIEEQQSGKFLGVTIQSSHFVKKALERIIDVGVDHEIAIVEIGGTLGDHENFQYFEAVRQLKQQHGNDVIITLVAPIFYLNTIKEFKTKPLQSSVKELQKYGLQADIIFCRTERDLPEGYLTKIADLTNVPKNQIFEAKDVPSIYQVPIEFYNRQVDDLVVDLLRLNRSSCRIHKYKELVEKYSNEDLPHLKIGIVVKYKNEEESYLDIREALIHAGINQDLKIDIQWIKSEDLEKCKNEEELKSYFKEVNGLIIGPGFGKRGIEGKISAIKFARENKIPILGICLGLQCMAIEVARDLCNLQNANSMEFDRKAIHPVVHYLPDQENIKNKVGTMRLGAYDCELTKDSIAMKLYDKKLISERHRHRLEINDKYLQDFEKAGFNVSGINPETNLVEIMELSNHPFFVGVQAHPEYKSRLTNPSPLFLGLIKASLAYKEN